MARESKNTEVSFFLLLKVINVTVLNSLLNSLCSCYSTKYFYAIELKNTNVKFTNLWKCQVYRPLINNLHGALGMYCSGTIILFEDKE